jgi:glycosyltransferase involved in cell wall biosynthesis
MRAIFYAPMANPDATAASGVPRMGVLLQRALSEAGVDVDAPRLPRTYDGRGDEGVQRAARDASERAAEELLARIRGGSIARPDFWFSYHVYYKSPDWVGPRVARELRIPYLTAECSHAPKRAGGPWALGHEGATLALSAANRLLAMTEFDRVCLDRLSPGRIRDLKPFIDIAPFGETATRGHGVPHLVAIGMMRNERKRASYAMLAAALKLLPDVPLRLTIAGDGVSRAEIEAMFRPAASAHQVSFAGEVASGQIPGLLSTADLFAWPGIGEAYGLAFLEAQAAGVPVVACRDRGVPDVTRDGVTALLCAPDNAAAYAANLRRFLNDADLRRRYGEAARTFVHTERSVAAAAVQLRMVLAELGLT